MSLTAFLLHPIVAGAGECIDPEALARPGPGCAGCPSGMCLGATSCCAFSAVCTNSANECPDGGKMDINCNGAQCPGASCQPILPCTGSRCWGVVSSGTYKGRFCRDDGNSRNFKVRRLAVS